MNNFSDVFKNQDWETVKKEIYSKTSRDVEHALNAKKLSLEDFKSLISPAAEPFLEQIAKRSHEITIQRFGKTIQLYAPMYLSNECNNICTYCGFSFDNKVKRRTLTPNEILEEINVIRKSGFEHILLVTGEANQIADINYIKNAVELILPKFSNITIEVQPFDENDYRVLAQAGVNGVLVYQETYNQTIYKNYHTKGKKSNFFYRLETADRLGNAKIHKTGLGVLLGLDDWRTDSFFCALHLDYLTKKYWQTKYSISFPRIRPADGVKISNDSVTDKNLVQLICAYRLFDPDVELSLSTRESEKFRDNVIKLGITSMSAGSKTNPGGYSVEVESLEQFEIDDDRTPAEVSLMIHNQGYEPVWKNWDKNYAG